MKITFFIIATLITTLMAGYVTLRGWQSFQQLPTLRFWFVLLNILLYAIMIFSLMTQGSLPVFVAKTITFVGFSYMIIMIYLLFAFLMVDIIRILNLIFHFAPDGMRMFRFWTATASLIIIALAMGLFMNLLAIVLSPYIPGFNQASNEIGKNCFSTSIYWYEPRI